MACAVLYVPPRVPKPIIDQLAVAIDGSEIAAVPMRKIAVRLNREKLLLIIIPSLNRCINLLSGQASKSINPLIFPTSKIKTGIDRVMTAYIDFDGCPFGNSNVHHPD